MTISPPFASAASALSYPSGSMLPSAQSRSYLAGIFNGREEMLPPGRGVRAGMVPSWAAYYDLMEAYYNTNALYETLRRAAIQYGHAGRAAKGIRCPAFRAVEFYTGKLWPGVLPKALPIETRNTAIIAPVEQIWTWSNWNVKKQVAARWIAEFGDLIIKIAQSGTPGGGNGRVYFQLIHPRYVTDMDTDERGIVTYIRIDLPQKKRFGDRVVFYTHTEVWEKDTNSYRAWDHLQSPGYAVEMLGTPSDEGTLGEFGIDFIPFVYAPFRDIGQDRAANAYGMQLDKIDEVNAMAVRLHQLMFRHNRPIWAVLSNMIDATRRAMPAPRIENNIGAIGVRTTPEADAILQGESVLYFPGQSRPELLIPNIAWDAYVKVLDEQTMDLEYDLPEMRYYRIVSEYKSNSGRALYYACSPAIDRAVEVRANIEQALVRADQMALTLAIAAGYFGTGIGNYDSTDPKENFDHAFRDRPIMPLSKADVAQEERDVAEAKERKHNVGVPYRTLWSEMGYNEDQIQQIEDQADTEQEHETQEAITAAKEMIDQQLIPPPTLPQPMGLAPRAPTANVTEQAPITTRTGAPPGRPPQQSPGPGGARQPQQARPPRPGSGVQSRGDPNLSR